MVRTTTLISSLMRALFLGVSTLVVIYFGYNLVIGDRGLLVLFQLEKQARELRTEFSEVQEERARMEHRIELMRSESLDPDMLDIRAREVLNFAHPTEITILRSIR